MFGTPTGNWRTLVDGKIQKILLLIKMGTVFLMQEFGPNPSHGNDATNHKRDTKFDVSVIFSFELFLFTYLQEIAYSLFPTFYFKTRRTLYLLVQLVLDVEFQKKGKNGNSAIVLPGISISKPLIVFKHNID